MGSAKAEEIEFENQTVGNRAMYKLTYLLLSALESREFFKKTFSEFSMFFVTSILKNIYLLWLWCNMYCNIASALRFTLVTGTQLFLFYVLEMNCGC